MFEASAFNYTPPPTPSQYLPVPVTAGQPGKYFMIELSGTEEKRSNKVQF
jgi:hypothetical protein